LLWGGMTNNRASDRRSKSVFKWRPSVFSAGHYYLKFQQTSTKVPYLRLAKAAKAGGNRLLEADAKVRSPSIGPVIALSTRHTGGACIN